jgi:hypothetical protein
MKDKEARDLDGGGFADTASSWLAGWIAKTHTNGNGVEDRQQNGKGKERRKK